MSASRQFSALLLDIEGTTTPISFVTEVLFPFAKIQYPNYIAKSWNDSSFAPYKNAFTAEDSSLTKDPETLTTFVLDKHAKNEKHTAFKSLQGALWKSGYEDGSIKSIVYEDVLTRLKSLPIGSTYIYSSGSIPAQKLLFRYSDQGDLTPLLSGYFDTSTAGPKTASSSYSKISKTTGINPKEWLFLSDNVKEVEAAKAAGMQSIIVVRPGNADLTDADRQAHETITTFQGI